MSALIKVMNGFNEKGGIIFVADFVVSVMMREYGSN